MLEATRATAILAVAAHRASYRTAASPDTPALPSGRLLVYFPDANLADGASEVASRGFFDVHNVPPWDTWIALARDPGASRPGGYDEYVVSRVPPALIATVQAGIDVNVEGCIAWLDESDVSARAELHALGSTDTGRT